MIALGRLEQDEMQANSRNATVTGRLIGYARVSTEEQGTDPQLDELRTAGCDAVREEHASGADRTRPVLASLLREIRPGETLVVVRLDRLARSVSHLLDVIEQLEAKGAHFRSLRDPIDTTTPQARSCATARVGRRIARTARSGGLAMRCTSSIQHSADHGGNRPSLAPLPCPLPSVAEEPKGNTETQKKDRHPARSPSRPW
jgi:Resolvase, N terminal domain